MKIPVVCLQKRFKSCLTNQAGVTYLFAMILVVTMSIALMGVTQQWSVILKRDREAELLFRGTRIKDAIDALCQADYELENIKATRPNRWPRTLEELTKKNPKRYLQAVYTDPITGEDFDLIKVGEELHGVRSTSTDVPYDQVNFKNVKTYQAIRFESTGAEYQLPTEYLSIHLSNRTVPPHPAQHRLQRESPQKTPKPILQVHPHLSSANSYSLPVSCRGRVR